MLRFSLAGF